MSEELQQPPVVDVDLILQPISEENPSGESLRYSGIYDEISTARKADDNLNQGDWQSELKVADFRRVIDLSVPALSTQTKDLQIAAWLCEALIKQHGFAGFRDGLKIVAGLQDLFWDTLHPEIDEGDMEGRANAVAWLDTQGSLAFKSVPITAGQGCSFIDWEDAKRFDFPEDIESLDSEAQSKWLDLRRQAENEHRVTGEQWRKAKAQTRRQFYEETAFILDECWAVYNELNRVIDEKYDRNQMPGLSNLKKAIDAVQTQVKKLLEEKRIEEPSESDQPETSETDAEEFSAAQGNGTGGSLSAGGVVQNRREALRRLGEIAAFFQKTEPHSPVAYLVQRAVKWGNMPLESWLQDVIKDENVLYSLRQTLGLDTAGDGENSGYADTSAAESSSEGW